MKRNEKFGIKLPKTVAEALNIDKENGNTLWADAIVKETKNVMIAFKIVEDDECVPTCH